MSDFSDIPEKISNLLALHAPDLTVKKSQADSAKSQLFHGSSVPSSVPEFLSIKLISLHQRVDYLNNLQRALALLEGQESISIAESRGIQKEVEKVKLSLRGEAIAIERYRNRMSEDMSDHLECSLRPDVDNAYTVAITRIVNQASGKQGKTRFDQSNFKKEVLEFYEASRMFGQTKKKFCHLLGWRPQSDVCAAHIVPKSLNEDSLVHLFGRELKPATDPRNALSLTKALEEALDSGVIVFVPVLDEKNAWKCVVTMTDNLNDEATSRYSWKDINGLHLQFNGPGRPRKIYLFFRYLITYLRHKREGNLEWAKGLKSESRACQWVSPGNYLRQSTLRTLLQHATGEELPETMFQMFDVTTDSGIDDPSHKENHREEDISHVVDSAVLNTHPVGPDEERESEGDGEYESASEY